MKDPNYLKPVLSESKFQAKEILDSIEKSLASKPNNFQDCVQWAREQFEELFANQIKQLLFNFPPDMMTPVFLLFQ
jgi:ubiquitin-activating enzyme E1